MHRPLLARVLQGRRHHARRPAAPGAHLGRPAALAIAKDGALLVADDTGGTVWKVSYTGETPAGAPAAATTGTGDGQDKP
jgi:glucose/arabinose dehydrogenase